MRKRIVLVGVAVALALGGVGFALSRGFWRLPPAAAQSQKAKKGVRAVPVDVTKVVKKKMPVRIESLGNVTPIAAVAVKTRMDSQITAVHFEDGAFVKKGDLLFTLDSRAIEAQIQQATGMLEKDQAQLAGAERDVRRYTALVAKGATPVTNLENAKTQAGTFRAAIAADEGALENLKVQLSYCSIRAPISGKISMAAVKVGNFVRAADATPLATLVQVSPIYVSFGAPQAQLPAIRAALEANIASVEANMPNESRSAEGKLTMIENMVDTTTGMVTLRATMQNNEQILWPGALVNVELTLRVEDAIVVPTQAVQTGQQGNYVFVVRDEVAHVQPVTVDRVVGSESVISKGLAEGQVVVTEGQLLLSDGKKVNLRPARTGKADLDSQG